MTPLYAAIDWLLTPLSGSSTHTIAGWASWHGRAMVLAWGVLVPIGALIARYFKITPKQRWPEQLDNKFWWRQHLRLQISGMAVCCVGLLLAFGNADGHFAAARWHALFGWTVAAAGAMQIVLGMLRGSKGGPTGIGARPELPSTWRGDHYDMTARRIWFERIHKSLGWLSVAVAVVTILLGLWVADAPRWMPIVLVVWWIALLGAATVWQMRGRCVDTYQAIWGPDPQHPGNRIKPIGWGIKSIAHPGSTTKVDLQRNSGDTNAAQTGDI